MRTRRLSGPFISIATVVIAGSLLISCSDGGEGGTASTASTTALEPAEQLHALLEAVSLTSWEQQCVLDRTDTSSELRAALDGFDPESEAGRAVVAVAAECQAANPLIDALLSVADQRTGGLTEAQRSCMTDQIQTLTDEQSTQILNDAIAGIEGQGTIAVKEMYQQCGLPLDEIDPP